MKAARNTQTSLLYEFGPFRVDVAKRRLLRNGEPVPLAPKAFDTLLVLMQHSGQALEKDELLQKVWPDVTVEENNLTQSISALRKALGDSRSSSHYIVTLPGWGYRFVADLKEVTSGYTEVMTRERTRTHIVIEEKETNRDADSRWRVADSVSAARLTAKIARHKKAYLITAMMFIVVATPIYFSVLRPQRFISKNAASEPSAGVFPKLDSLKLTANIDVRRAAISPDGKYVVYLVHNAGLESLWLRQVAVANTQQIIPPAAARYFGLVFSPDGNYLYFIRSEKDDSLRTLYRMPALGGASKKLLEDLEDSLTFSPEGNRIAFTRGSRIVDESALMIANEDGTQEHKLAQHSLANRFAYPSWSPDGKFIVCAVGTAHSGGTEMALVEVNAEEGSERPFTSQSWEHIGQIGWLSNGNNLLMIAREQGSALSRIWSLSYPEAQGHSITSDSSYYVDVSLARDSRTLAAVHRDLISNIWILPDGDVSRVYQTTHAAGNLSWTPDGRIVCASQAGGNQDIWIMNADGSGQKQLTADAVRNAGPVVSRDGRYIVFVSDRSGAFHIWRMNIDGSDPVQLTKGSGENMPAISPDGKWTIYASVSDWTLWKVPIGGGDSIKLTGGDSFWPAVSPDGKWIAYFHRVHLPTRHYTIEVTGFDGGEQLKRLDVPHKKLQSLNIQWTPDGKALAYAAERDDISNIWAQPLDGGKPVRLTNFNSDQIFNFAWSPDGRQLACVRGSWTGNVVLISNFK